jgi:hypothetical protein
MIDYVTGDDIGEWLLDLSIKLHAAGMVRESRAIEQIVKDLDVLGVDVDELEWEISSLRAELRELREDNDTNVVPLKQPEATT